MQVKSSEVLKPKGKPKRQGVMVSSEADLERVGAKRRVRWAMYYDKCIGCGTIEKKHSGKGLCANCYMKKNYRDRYNEKYPWMKSYSNAQQRCCNPKNTNYPKYGGKGIKFFMTSKDFEHLWKRDNAGLMKKPSIDRIDSKKDYTLENCRFIEFSENSNHGNCPTKKVFQFTLSGVFMRAYKSQKEAKEKTGAKDISLCTLGIRKSSGGYKWEGENVR
jgi:hypothetical protein